MGRIMAVDYGDARIGLAVSDATGLICGDAWTLKEWNMERASQTIAAEAKQRGVSTIVLGLPKNMDGTEGPRAEKAREFSELLKKEKKHRETVDAVAAALLLESYLGSIK